MTRAERAIRALREAADALDDIPNLRRTSLLGPYLVSAERLREEADWIESVIAAIKEQAFEETSKDDEPGLGPESRE